MKKIFVVVMLLALVALSLVGCGGQQATKDSSSKIVVGLDDNFPPMGFKNSETNDIVGFDIDLAKEATKRLGCEVEFKAIDWSSKEAELKSGRIDVLWNGLDITEKRKENMMFSDPYMDNRQIIFVPKGNPKGIKDQASLAGKNIGTQSGSTTDEYFNSNETLKASLNNLSTYGDYVAAFMDLSSGRLDAVVGDEIVGRYYMQKVADQIEVIDVSVGPVSSFGVGFRKEDQKLRDEVQKVLDEMKKDGTMGKFSEKWFGADIIKK